MYRYHSGYSSRSCIFQRMDLKDHAHSCTERNALVGHQVNTLLSSMTVFMD